MNKPNQYNGGIWSLKDLQARCFVEPGSGCWLWRLSFNRGAPNVTIRMGGQKFNMRGKRAAKCLEQKQILPSQLECWGRVGCSADCVNPAHVIAGTAAERGAYASEHGLQKNIVSRLAAAKIGGMTRRKLTQEQVNKIRSGDDSTESLAREFGVSRYAIWAVRTYKNWREETAPNSSVFNWRPAA